MKVRDEVCGMEIDAHSAAATVEYAGKTYYFCSEGCARSFRERPDSYVPPRPPAS